MKAGRALLVLALVNLIAWTLKVTNHFFDYHLADEIGLLCTLTIIYLISRNFQGTKRLPFWVTALILTSIILMFYPVLSYALQRTDYAWVIPNILFGAIGVLLGNTSLEQLKTAPLLLIGGLVWLIPFDFIPDQSLYFDHLVESTDTRSGKIHRVLWKGEQWIHYNGRLTSSTMDAHLYYEPLVHPIMSLTGKNSKVLLIGGDNGLALAEIEKYDPEKLVVIPLDMAFFERSIKDKKEAIDSDPFIWLNENLDLFDVIILDLPDPIDITTNQYYTLEFYALCQQHLTAGGLLVTQASSPYFHATTHYSIKATIEAAAFQTVNYHNQVPTIGQWGWVIATKEQENLKRRLENTSTEVTTRWWDQEAMQMMLSFGKRTYFDQQTPVINTIKEPLFLSKP